ncbi:MATE family efflux transporter [Clostridium polynesiense]|uniref:MATE family efflux transporter n=1 Tax=Clostridium polynesiense TaxID=1325933 RepID=UPI00058FC4AB|nr:MATE family efflux transporter [Clostridium polynesiense]
MQLKENKNYLFTNKDLYKLIIPLIIEQLLSIAVGMADSMMVASVGEAAVSAVSLVDSVIVLLVNVFAALATGGAVVAGQYIGRKKEEEACETADQIILFTGLLSIAIMLLMYIGKNFILNNIFGAIDADVKAYAETYLMIVSLSIPFIALYNGGAALFRTMGNSKITMITSLVMNIINIVGNAVLIYGLKIGIAGAAIPTLISRTTAAVIIIILLKNQNLMVHLTRPFKFHFKKRMIKKILHIGIPNGLENSMFQLGKILLLSLVASFGTASIAANAVSNTVAMFQILPGLSIGLAVLTIVSRCIGAGDYKQARHYTRKLLSITYISMIAVNILLMAALPLIVKIYNLTDVTAQITMKILIYHGFACTILWPAAFTLPNTLRAANDVRFSMFISIASMWIWRIGFAFILGKYLNLGVFGVWVAMTIDWLFRVVAFVVRYRSKKWENLRI